MARIPYWNISYGPIIDMLAVPLIIIWVYAMIRIWKRIMAAKPELDTGLSVSALKIGPIYLKGLLTRGILGSRIYAKLFTGIAHGGLFWGMVLLAIGTSLVFLEVLFELAFHKNVIFTDQNLFNQYFMSFTLDIAGVLAVAGTLFLLLRRLAAPPERLTEYKSRIDFVAVELLILVVLVTGFLVESLRIAANGPDPYSVVGNFLAGLFANKEVTLVSHRLLWWVHGLAAMTLMAYIPFSALKHLVLAPINCGLAVPIPGPKMGVLDFSAFENEDSEETPVLGVAKLSDFSRDRLLDFETCLWCGRCHEVCPAAQTGKELSPKKIMVSMAEQFAQGRTEDPCMSDTVTSAAVFSCTTCSACMEVCPVSINQPNAIMRLRQNLVMEQSEMPEAMANANKSLEARQHPFFGTASGPNDWRKGLEVPFFEQGKTEYMLWIGCTATYEERAQKIARAMVEILLKAGVSFGILEEARCTGDPAKQMGNEFLFSEIAQQNIEDFASLEIKKIITLCPHCFNSFTRHYPPLGGNYEVIPHSVMLKKLIDEGKIDVKKMDQSICYHDPCYLGRRNSIYDDPRQVLAKTGNCVEMPRNKADSFCCGAGGGNYWAEEEGTRINKTRAKEALETSTDMVATACPFCLLMLTDGMKGQTEDDKVFDIAEIVRRSME
ncbi:MAG: (Fe-S)-binding protein [Syntrophobacteraceae bacterium]